MNKIRNIYLKTYENIDEVFETSIKLPVFMKKIILLYKRLLCCITIRDDGIAILPYKKIQGFSKIKIFLISKVLKRINLPIVLSEELFNIEELKKSILKTKLRIIENGQLSYYLTLEIIEYICKMIKIEKQKQEITILINTNASINNIINMSDFAKIIIDLAQEFKMIHIVTENISKLKSIEKTLEENFGIYCQITNNKRKSLSKAQIIVNLNYSDNMLNEFNINPNAIIIDVIEKVNIQKKSFSGIHIYDYEIDTNDKKYKDIFSRKKILELEITGKNYNEVRNIIKESNVVLKKLYGKNGEINYEEYVRIKNEKTVDK